jgi:hypothetical protein
MTGSFYRKAPRARFTCDGLTVLGNHSSAALDRQPGTADIIMRLAGLLALVPSRRRAKRQGNACDLDSPSSRGSRDRAVAAEGPTVGSHPPY